MHSRMKLCNIKDCGLSFFAMILMDIRKKSQNFMKVTGILRSSLKRATQIFDIAASADIEDIMLIDLKKFQQQQKKRTPLWQKNKKT